MPKRVQNKRGQKKPPNTVLVRRRICGHRLSERPMPRRLWQTTLRPARPLRRMNRGEHQTDTTAATTKTRDVFE